MINTGTRSRRLDIPGADLPHVHDSTTLQHVDPLPQRLVIVGAGPIGLEFAGMFADFGFRRDRPQPGRPAAPGGGP